jgi:hypothetical protein
MENYDCSYELTDEQLLHYSALPAIAKLRWLDEARRFTLLAREARTKGSRVEDSGALEKSK